MFSEIIRNAEYDSHLKGLCSEAQDISRLYLFARARQKGCDGLGELNNLKDELSLVLEKIISYCRTKKLIAGNDTISIDSLIKEIEDSPC